MGKDCPVCPKRGKIHKLLTLCRVFLGGDFGYILPAVFSVVSTWCSLYSNFRLWGRNRSYVKRRFLPLRSPAINFTGYSGGISGNIWIWRNSSGFPLLFATWGFRIRSLRLLYFSFLFYLFFFSESCRFQPRWVLFSFSFFVLPFPQDSRIRLSLSLAGNGRKVCQVALCSCASLCIAFLLAVCFFVSSPSLFVCLQDGGYGCVCCGMTVLSVVLPAGEWRIRRLFFFFLARSDTGFGGNIRGFGEIKSGVKRNAGGSYEITYGGWQRGV